MATQAEIKQRYAEWQEHCKHIQSITDTALLIRETPVEKDRRIRRLQKDYAAFCKYYFPHFLQLRDKVTGEVIRTIHNAPFHNTAAAKVKNTPNLKAVFKWPRGHAKSTHFDIFMPLWLMFQPKRLINFMVVVGKSEDSAMASADKPIFKVQILASGMRLAPGSSHFKGLEGVDSYEEGGLIKYTYGASADYNEVYRMRKSILDKFPEAFIIAFKNGEKMNVNQAIREFKSK